MSLRARLFVTGLLVALPLAVGWFFIDSHMRLRTKEDELRQSVAFDVASGLRTRCEATPPQTGRPGRGGNPPRSSVWDLTASDAGPRGGRRPPGSGADGTRGRTQRGALASGGSGAYEYFAYDRSGHTDAADAPPLPAERSGESTTTYWTRSGPGVALVVPLGADGPCAYILARIPPRPAELRDQTQALVLVVISVLAAAWIAAGPVISRLRRLADGVRQSAASHYADPVAVEGQDEVSRLAAAFNDAAQRIRVHVLDVQSREETLRCFVANTTHDVAIPLSVLQGHLAELVPELLTPAQRQRLQGAVREAHYMGSLLRNLATATRLDGPNEPLALSLVDLSAVVERVVTRHQPIARASGVELNMAVPESPLVLTSEPTLIEQALSNLVDNAVRYNNAGGHVAVVLDREESGFLLSVTDDGRGVAEAELAHLTSRWFRGSDARTRRPDGRGLGLAIASESVSRIGLTLGFVRPGTGGLRAEIRGNLTP